MRTAVRAQERGLRTTPGVGLGRRVDAALIAERLAPAIHWPGAVDATQRYWRVLARTPDFDAWVIAWPQGGKVELHDHGSSSGALVVLEGRLIESVPWRDDTGTLSVVRHELQPGQTLSLAADHIHDVTNEAPDHALSVHVYSPPLTSMTHYDIVANRLVARPERFGHHDAMDAASLWRADTA